MEAEMLDFMRHIRPRVATTTYRRKHWQIRSFKRHLETEKIQYFHVKQKDVEKYLLALRCTRQYRQAVCSIIKEFYEYLKIRYPLLCPEKNPANEIVFRPDTSRKLFKVPSQAAIDEIFDRLSDATSEISIRDRLMAELAYGSGLRRTELMRLNIEDIDHERGTVQVLGKGDKPRIVPLTRQATETMQTYLAKRGANRGPLLISWMGRRLSGQGVWHIYKYRIGLRPHLFRHACATHMLKNGCNLRVIQELLGHQRLSTTYIYTSIDTQALQTVLNATHPRRK